MSFKKNENVAFQVETEMCLMQSFIPLLIHHFTTFQRFLKKIILKNEFFDIKQLLLSCTNLVL